MTTNQDLIKTKPVRPNVSVQAKYRKNLESLSDYVIKQTEREVSRLIKKSKQISGITADASEASIVRIALNKLFSNLAKIVGRKAKIFAERMVGSTDRETTFGLAKSLDVAKISIGRAEGSDEFKALISANVDLIKTMQDRYISQIKGVMYRSIQKGGLELSQKEIGLALTKQAKQLKNKAKNVALDQTRKAYSSLTSVKMERAGVKKFKWIHSGGGQNPRAYHQNFLNGKTFELANPPIIDRKTGERGLPGQAINCKCIMQPVIEYDTEN